MPFRYEWLDETFKEMATFVFFVMTGYKFRPASNNPYFAVSTEDYDMEEVLIGSTGINEQVMVIEIVWRNQTIKLYCTCVLGYQSQEEGFCRRR